jgi:hypothetical protein
MLTQPHKLLGRRPLLNAIVFTHADLFILETHSEHDHWGRSASRLRRSGDYQTEVEAPTWDGRGVDVEMSWLVCRLIAAFDWPPRRHVSRPPARGERIVPTETASSGQLQPGSSWDAHNSRRIPRIRARLNSAANQIDAATNEPTYCSLIARHHYTAPVGALERVSRGRRQSLPKWIDAHTSLRPHLAPVSARRDN